MINSLDSMRPDLRLHRAQVLVATVMQTIGKYICEHDQERDLHSRAHDDLLKALHDSGADFITDDDRRKYGLPPRGPDGWSAQELQVLEAKRLEVMLRPNTIYADPKTVPQTP